MKQPTVPATSLWRLLLLALGAGLVVWTVLHVIDARSVDALSGPEFAVPWSLPVGLLAIAGGVAVTARAWHRRLGELRRAGGTRPDPDARGARPLDPLAAARGLGLAKACSHAGSLITGAYGGYAALLVPGAGAPLRHERLIDSGITAFAALLLVLAGLLLERSLRLPDDPEGPLGT